MATVSKTRKPVKRTIRLALPPFEDNPGVITITVGKLVVDYFLTRLAADYGIAWEVEKVDPKPGEEERYHVNLDPQEGGHSCDCKGFLRWGHCKHSSGLWALHNAGKL
jgi:hypothetical protein